MRFPFTRHIGALRPYSLLASSCCDGNQRDIPLQLDCGGPYLGCFCSLTFGYGPHLCMVIAYIRPCGLDHGSAGERSLEQGNRTSKSFGVVKVGLSRWVAPLFGYDVCHRITVPPTFTWTSENDIVCTSRCQRFSEWRSLRCHGLIERRFVRRMRFRCFT